VRNHYWLPASGVSDNDKICLLGVSLRAAAAQLLVSPNTASRPLPAELVASWTKAGANRLDGAARLAFSRDSPGEAEDDGEIRLPIRETGKRGARPSCSAEKASLASPVLSTKDCDADGASSVWEMEGGTASR